MAPTATTSAATAVKEREVMYIKRRRGSRCGCVHSAGGE